MDILRLGIFFDLPVLTLILFGLIAARHHIARLGSHGPVFKVIAFLASAALAIIIEENINCGQFNCETTLWPPTANFLLALTILLGAIVALLRVKNIARTVLACSLIGLLFEVFAGGSAAAFRALDPIWFLLISALTLVSYAVIFCAPFTIMFAGRK